MGYSQIAYEVSRRIATVTLDRPDRLNAFTPTMREELVDVMDRIDGDDTVRVAVFTGRGRGFCAGADLESGADTFTRGSDAFNMAEHADGGGVVTQRLFRSSKPLIAAINGPAVGVGVTMTLPMDVRMAADGARFGFVFSRRGLVPEACSSWFLPRIVGIQQAAEWVYTGRVFDAEEALRGGLLRSIHPADELLDAVYALAGEIATGTSAVAVAQARAMLWRMLGEPSPASAHAIDSRGIFAMARTADVAEGVTSFLEKRPAQFPLRVSRDLPAYFERWQAAGSVAEFLEREG